MSSLKDAMLSIIEQKNDIRTIKIVATQKDFALKPYLCAVIQKHEEIQQIKRIESYKE